MSLFTFHLPDLGEGVVEGEVVRVLVKEGDRVEEDQFLAEVMTDKATVQIPSPKKGLIAKVHVKEGQMVPVEAPMFTIALEAQPIAPAPLLETPTMALVPAVVVPAGERYRSPTTPTAVAATPNHAPAPPPPTGPVLATPATRQLARDLGVNLRSVSGSGKDGRVTKEDVERASRAPQPSLPSMPPAPPPPPRITTVEELRVRPSTPGDPQVLTPTTPQPRPAITPSVDFPTVKRQAPAALTDTDREERLPLRGLRKTIAQNMVRSKFTAPHFTYVEEADVTPLVALRDRTRPLAEERGVKLSFLPFILKAVVAGLRQFPMVNSSLDEATNEIIVKRYYHLGVATATEHGLTVVVARDADKKSLLGLAREIDELAKKAREGKAGREELSGSTFTVTSLGKLGGLLATPILNYPEVGIMGIHKIARRPVVKDEQIVIRDIMNVSLSFDHRVIDGAVGAAFTAHVIRYLENPDLLLLEGI